MITLTLRSIASGLVDKIEPVLWMVRQYSQPAPRRVKQGVLYRYGHSIGTWIESGTYLGKTTKWLSSFAEQVITIEPDSNLAHRAAKKLARHLHVQVIHGYSEVVLEELLMRVSNSVAFWLDGHFSGGITAIGTNETPIRRELELIEDHLDRFSTVVVFIDDFRHFESGSRVVNAYPSRTELVEWAEKNSMFWTVEHDIFVAIYRKPNF